MGLLDFFLKEFVEVIDWVEKDKDTVLWKFPDKDANIKYGASLTVRESQVALFLDEGQFADVYDPGRYELNTQNMPVLTSLKNWDKGFNSPFKADVYFLSTKKLGYNPMQHYCYYKFCHVHELPLPQQLNYQLHNL